MVAGGSENGPTQPSPRARTSKYMVACFFVACGCRAACLYPPVAFRLPPLAWISCVSLGFSSSCLSPFTPRRRTRHMPTTSTCSSPSVFPHALFSFLWAHTTAACYIIRQATAQSRSPSLCSQKGAPGKGRHGAAHHHARLPFSHNNKPKGWGHHNHEKKAGSALCIMARRSLLSCGIMQKGSLSCRKKRRMEATRHLRPMKAGGMSGQGPGHGLFLVSMA